MSSLLKTALRLASPEAYISYYIGALEKFTFNLTKLITIYDRYMEEKRNNDYIYTEIKKYIDEIRRLICQHGFLLTTRLTNKKNLLYYVANCEPLSIPVTSLLKRHIESHIDNYDSNNNAFLSYNKESSMITVNIPNLIDVLAFVNSGTMPRLMSLYIYNTIISISNGDAICNLDPSKIEKHKIRLDYEYPNGKNIKEIMQIKMDEFKNNGDNVKLGLLTKLYKLLTNQDLISATNEKRGIGGIETSATITGDTSEIANKILKKTAAVAAAAAGGGGGGYGLTKRQIDSPENDYILDKLEADLNRQDERDSVSSNASTELWNNTNDRRSFDSDNEEITTGLSDVSFDKLSKGHTSLGGTRKYRKSRKSCKRIQLYKFKTHYKRYKKSKTNKSHHRRINKNRK